MSNFQNVERRFRPRIRRPKSRRRLKLYLSIAAVALLLVAMGISILATQVMSVRSHLETAVRLAPELQEHLKSGDHESAQQTFSVLEEQIRSARSEATGPLWKAASVVPFLGPNFTAVSEVTVSASDVVSRAVGPLLDIYDSLDWQRLSPTDGRIDHTLLARAEPTISSAANTVQLSYERLIGIELDPLLPSVAGPIDSATQQLLGINESLQVAAWTAQLLPGMLGEDGERNYLILIQNSAEIRATGGIPGALAVVSANKGRVDLSAQSSASAIGAFTPPLTVPADQEALYTTRLGTQMQNVNLTPDFPTAASTAKRMWERGHGGDSIDGVVALDPVVLGHLLRATGPVELQNQEVLGFVGKTTLPAMLTADNVSSVLLSDVYREIEDPAVQDLYFAEVAAAVFDAFTHGHADGGALIDALIASTEENRVLLWSSHDSEQEIIKSAGLAGSVSGTGSGGASFGVFFNDGTGAKMDYYARRTVELHKACPAQGYESYVVRLIVSNMAPTDASASLPGYVTANGRFGVDPGHIRTNYVFYGPEQSLVKSAKINGTTVPLGSGMHDRRPVGTVTVEVAPGESSEVELIFSNVVQESTPQLRVTPTVQPMKDVVLPYSRETSCGN